MVRESQFHELAGSESHRTAWPERQLPTRRRERFAAHVLEHDPAPLPDQEGEQVTDEECDERAGIHRPNVEPERLKPKQGSNHDRFDELLPAARWERKWFAEHESREEHYGEQRQSRDEPGTETGLPGGCRNCRDDPGCDHHEDNAHRQSSRSEQDDERTHHDDRKQPVGGDPPPGAIERHDQSHNERAHRCRIEDMPAAECKQVFAGHRDECREADRKKVSSVEDWKKQHPQNKSSDQR